MLKPTHSIGGEHIFLFVLSQMTMLLSVIGAERLSECPHEVCPLPAGSGRDFQGLSARCSKPSTSFIVGVLGPTIKSQRTKRKTSPSSQSEEINENKN